jgi:hypothetical protein
MSASVELETPTIAAAPARAIGQSNNSRYLGLTLLLLFLTAAGVQNAIVLTWINVTGGNLSQPGTIYGLALVFAQQGLVALACGFSRQHIAMRTVLFLAAVFVSGDLAGRYDGRPGLQGTWMLAMLAHGCLVLCYVCWMRGSIGLVLVLDDEPPPARPIRWQFRLIRLFAVTTIAAVLLGLFSRLRIDGEQLPDLLFEAAILSIVPVQVGYCVLARARFATLVIVGFATVVALGALLSLALPDGDLLCKLWMTLLQSLMIHAAASIVQQAGYRLEDTGKKVKKPPDQGSGGRFQKLSAGSSSGA